MNGQKVLMKGNEAIAEAAIRAGCRAYFGYPITPQNEIIAYMAKHLMKRGGVFIQAESEVAAVNMVYGASAAGARAMTSSSSPGISLKQEGISYAAGADIPMVIVNVARGGPGLGSISPAQSDYIQSTRGGGHGDYRCIVLAPKSVQECADLTALAFELSDAYRMPAILLADGIIGQMMEGVVLPPALDPAKLPARDWAVGRMAAHRRAARHISSLALVPEELEAKTRARFDRYETVKAAETRFEAVDSDGADVVMVAYGTSARVALGARELARAAGIRAGVFRPITLWPFPAKALGKIAARGKPVLVVEMSLGQMIDDVKLAIFDEADGARPPVKLLGHSGGVIPTEEEVFAAIKRIVEGKT
ncbi:MAG: 3-methyl-2-oxobutanoate dehydrogenase subunit VorB [Spirochaetaceae bacterium]|jgi:2-oxoglutarate ferredoxin oxidoreductase subunit alpha|nr:3-methyl-2-oxobutanoate dehydrogenase subunit VorB [Spirochaetaceae bacterium]